MATALVLSSAGPGAAATNPGGPAPSRPAGWGAGPGAAATNPGGPAPSGPAGGPAGGPAATGPTGAGAAPPPTTAPDTLPADLAAVAGTAPAAGLAPPASGADGPGGAARGAGAGEAGADEGGDAAVPAAEVASELALAIVSGPTVAEAERALDSVAADLRVARADQVAAAAERDELARQVGELEVDRSGLDAELAGHRQREQVARARADEVAIRADQVRDLLQELAAAAYMGVGTDPPQLESPKVTDGSRRTTYRRNVFELKRAEWLGHLEQQRAAQAEADAAAADVGRVLARTAAVEASRSQARAASGEAEQRRAAAAAREATLGVRRQQAETVLAEARRTANVVGLDMPLVVLDAIWSATGRMAAERPTCHLRWNLLAAISRVESGHGRFGTSVVDRRGGVQPRIVGPPLDGTRFALIPDTDSGRLDGDTAYDRAVGPMQFIPSSWALFGRDGNGDGLGDPNNYYDATLAAAEHLCRAGADTATEAGLRAAVLSYNPSEDYLRSVVTQALAYARFIPTG